MLFSKTLIHKFIIFLEIFKNRKNKLINIFQDIEIEQAFKNYFHL